MISNIEELAEFAHSTVDKLKDDVRAYTDCGMAIDWNDEAVSLRAESDSGHVFIGILQFPFAGETYDEMIVRMENQVEDANICYD